MLKVFVGWEPREIPGYQVTVRSLLEHTRYGHNVEVQPLVEPHLRALGHYRRRHERRDGRLWDSVSQAPMATEFALTRFLVPALCQHRGWAVFCDCDFLWRADVCELLEYADPRHAVCVVKHDHRPPEQSKMDGQIQTVYPRKNWSSLMLINCAHPAHGQLTTFAVNAALGRMLHAFAWLRDSEIGALPEAWNWLEGWSAPDIEPKAVHYTRGTPDMAGYEHAPYAEEWRAVLGEVAA